MQKQIDNLYGRTHWFTEHEAWVLFRLAAFGEAMGWTLLIIGVLFDHYHWSQHASVLLLAGRLHGMLFIIYVAASLFLSKSLGLSKRLMVLAAILSVPPYATLVFEQWLARRRRTTCQKGERQVSVRAVIAHGSKLLAMQPKDRSFWCLPGGVLQAQEGPEQALKRLVYGQTGHKPTIGRLLYTYDYQHGQRERLELFYEVINATAFGKIQLSKAGFGKLELDELRFIDPKVEEIMPSFIHGGRSACAIEHNSFTKTPD